MKKKILVISKDQFGNNTDLFNHCMNLKDKYDISFIGIDKGFEKKYIKDVKVNNIRSFKNRYINMIMFYILTILNIYKTLPHIIFIPYFKTCSIYTYFYNKKRIIVDIRSATINNNKDKRKKLDGILSKEANKFLYRTVISEGVKKRLNLINKNTFILPLGAKTVIEDYNKQIFCRNKLELLYVGTFDNRNIEDTIKAFNKLSTEVKGIDLNYTIIGYSNDKIYEELINKEINNNKFNNIKYEGKVDNEKLKEYFEKSNVGISYIPITEYFNYQPPTKTYEYIFNGLLVVGTSTFENEKIINDLNGFLIKDNVNEVYNVLKNIYENRDRLNRKKRVIIETVKEYSWDNISEKLNNIFQMIYTNV